MFLLFSALSSNFTCVPIDREKKIFFSYVANKCHKFSLATVINNEILVSIGTAFRRWNIVPKKRRGRL